MTELQLVAIIKPARIGGSNLFRRSNKSGREEGILDKFREHDYARKNHFPPGWTRDDLPSLPPRYRQIFSFTDVQPIE